MSVKRSDQNGREGVRETPVLCLSERPHCRGERHARLGDVAPQFAHRFSGRLGGSLLRTRWRKVTEQFRRQSCVGLAPFDEKRESLAHQALIALTALPADAVPLDTIRLVAANGPGQVRELAEDWLRLLRS
jgi:hypothetical protein